MKRIKENINILFIIFVAFLMYKLIDRWDYIFVQFKVLRSLLSPFIWAFAFAYILNPLMVKIEMTEKVSRWVSLVVVYLFVLGIIILLSTIITPVIARNITEIIDKLPRFIEAAERWVRAKIIEFSFLEELGINTYVFNNINTIFTRSFDFLNITISGLLTSVIGITSGIAKVILGLLISIYMLFDKEKFISSIKKLFYAVLGEGKAENVFDFAREANKVFKNFFVGKLIDSMIIGIICFVGLYILKVEFALLFSIIVGVFNMIPYFGPFIGAVPVVAITLFYSPIKALWVLIFIIGLQQFDGWILGPKILGDKVGLSPFYIILAIIIGGGYFGVMGMLLGVPVLKTLFLLSERIINRRLKEKNIDFV
ncbi:putative PurR-regulated permease PerM [Acetoanaerobium pronyense]|uniref:PurR-regulated permease PerM n=1 Tax=Acetoanaerobium pronyense TaxID=1482736 RepID=A0ABS4KP69_9FIRM|nr:AI-2E family transporter [Acetoanaerobium pronyense]MBP2028414.1 putative PurR-regulated permease PerM [Acetoanaerobium pronyense]